MIISGQGCVMKLGVLTEPVPECDNIYSEISNARREFEQEIEQLMESYRRNHGPLNCSVCVSPCHKSEINKSNYGCLQILGLVGKVGQEPLW